MVQETLILPFDEWLAQAASTWLIVLLATAGIAAGFCWLVAAIGNGPLPAVLIVYRTTRSAVIDFVCLSPRRTFALAWLAIKESIRRRVVGVFALFVVLMLIGGWFLDPSSNNPAGLYIDAVLSTTTYLVLIMMIFLAALSLPKDIKDRTIYTIVTKPVRASEIIVGRVLGFTAIGTAFLVVTGLLNYVFVVRGLDHRHVVSLGELKPETVVAAAGEKSTNYTGKTSRVQQHRHKLSVEADGRATLETEHGHSHSLVVDPARLAEAQDGKKEIRVETGAPQDMFHARVPVYGKLRFLDRSGKPSAKGVNVGDEWMHRSYIEGGSLAAAVWTFEGVTEDRFPDGLPVEMTLGVFRTHKGNIEKGVLASLSVANPATGQQIETRIFPSKEFVIDRHLLPRSLKTADGKKLDLFRDLVADGRVEIWLRCLDPAQYFGAAQSDMYLHARDSSFQLNFAKGNVGIWTQMVLLISVAVMFSAFLSAPVAWVATVAVLVGGMCLPFILEVAGHKQYGGGPAESLIRMLTQDNVLTDLQPGLRTTAAKMTDKVLEPVIGGVAALLPDIRRFDYANYVSSGFDVPPDLMAQHLVALLAYMAPLLVAAYLFLKTREVAQ